MTEEELGRQVITKARKYADRWGKSAPKAARSLRLEKNYGRTVVRYGGAQWPYAMGAEFGSYRFKRFHSFRRSGYFVYQARWEVENRDMEEAFYRAFSDAVRRAFPE
ncbi:hypothetical protein [Streptomyces smyrnaeus]|uniref:hypothetical protein n=1 Tax=Streptomyces smyrnaeus TaxID=1387713 RepID=UPI0036A50885